MDFFCIQTVYIFTTKTNDALKGTSDQVMTQHLVAPNRPALRCNSSKQLTITCNSRREQGNFSPQSTRARFNQMFLKKDHQINQGIEVK